MKHHSWILAGTALALVMTGPFAMTPASARAASIPAPSIVSAGAPLVLAQADETAEQRRKRLAREKAAAAKKAQAAAKAKKKAAAAEEPAAEAAEPAAEAAAPIVEESVSEPEAPAAEGLTSEPPTAVPAEEGAPKKKKKPAVKAVAEPEAPAAEEPAAEEAVVEPEAPAVEEPTSEPATAAPAEEVAPKKKKKPAGKAAAKTEAPAAEEPAAEAPEAPAAELPAAEPATEPNASAAEDSAASEPAVEPKASTADEPAANEPATTEQPAVDEAPVDEAAPADAETAPKQAGEAAPEDAAPVLDSQKQKAKPAGKGKKPAKGTQAAKPAPAEPAGPPPADDAQAQAKAKPERVRPVAEEKGKRVKAPAAEDRRLAERPEGAEIVREIGDRVIIEFNANIFVESNDRPRLARGAREVYYEELRNGRVRETVVRKDGTMVVTVRNRYGDIIQRSRIEPDGREVVLVYVDERNWDRVIDWRDPGDDLPPLRLTIPIREYVLEAERVEDPDVYYTFLDQPPVEQVERLYSIDEVKRSARIRDKTRRVELDSITFEFGKADIEEDQVSKLEGVADAMLRLLEENPAETFLIEGHTDAVGSDLANLALSDQRAEAVAQAMTDVFGIPPENLTTQGYGEEYLKVNTEEPERENRRVAMRRITALVAPAETASAN